MQYFIWYWTWAKSTSIFSIKSHYVLTFQVQNEAGGNNLCDPLLPKFKTANIKIPLLVWLTNAYHKFIFICHPFGSETRGFAQNHSWFLLFGLTYNKVIKVNNNNNNILKGKVRYKLKLFWTALRMAYLHMYPL